MSSDKFANGHKFKLGVHEIEIGLFGGRPYIQYCGGNKFPGFCLSWSTHNLRELSYEQFWYDGPHRILNLWWIGLYWSSGMKNGSEDSFELRLI